MQTTMILISALGVVAGVWFFVRYRKAQVFETNIVSLNQGESVMKEIQATVAVKAFVDLDQELSLALSGIEDFPPVVGTELAGTSSAKLEPGMMGEALAPGGVALAWNLSEWLNPDPAVVRAVEQATHSTIENALDLHRTIAAQDYDLLSSGSFYNWRGHVGEQQTYDLLNDMAPGEVSMPENSNFEGGDISVAGHDFQVKFSNDFKNIDNIHGDTLIVPADQMNIPDHAITLNVGDPGLDTLALTGHDVIVGSSLSLADAGDAWESVVGVAAGGFDSGDVVDSGLNGLIPGIGTAIRVAMSSHRRRAAIKDSSLRADALKRVSQEAAEGVVAVSFAAGVGQLVGSFIDGASMGATLGLGTTFGATIGAMVGGIFTGKRSKERDQKHIDSAGRVVRHCLDQYGQELSAVEGEMDAEWKIKRGHADADADAMESELSARVRAEHDGLRAKLIANSHFDKTQTSELLDPIIQQLRKNLNRKLSRSQRNLHVEWLAQADSTLQQDAISVEQVCSLLACVPEQLGQVSHILETHSSCHARHIMNFNETVKEVRVAGIVARTEILKKLRIERERIEDRATKKLDKYIQRVETANAELKNQLMVAGRLK
jgi:hypothetical protein